MVFNRVITSFSFFIMIISGVLLDQLDSKHIKNGALEKGGSHGVSESYYHNLASAGDRVIRCLDPTEAIKGLVTEPRIAVALMVFVSGE